MCSPCIGRDSRKRANKKNDVKYKFKGGTGGGTASSQPRAMLRRHRGNKTGWYVASYLYQAQFSKPSHIKGRAVYIHNMTFCTETSRPERQRKVGSPYFIVSVGIVEA